jgi:hypothetical protein
MKLTERMNFAECLMGLGALYGKPVNEFLIEIYWQACAKYEFQDVQKSLQAHVNNPDQGQFMPKPADIVRYLEGTSHTQALQAWSEVMKGISSAGCYSSVVFDDPIIHAVLSEMGGWISICKINEEELPFKAREFEKRYAAYVLHKPKNYPSYLVGLIELQNSAHGHPFEKPLLLGDHQKALAVYQQGNNNLSSNDPLITINQAVKTIEFQPTKDIQEGV